jgi:micrococcal nuclease
VRRLCYVIFSAIVAAACSSSSLLSGATATTAPIRSLEPNAVVDFVIDGDTIDVIIDGREERVRLTGIDTPEKARRDGSAPEECFAEAATDFAIELLPIGTPVQLVRDVVARDDFGRMLAYVYRADDGIFVNYEIVRQGYAQPLTIPPNVEFSELMVEAARNAEADNVGLWAACAE